MKKRENICKIENFFFFENKTDDLFKKIQYKKKTLYKKYEMASIY